MKNMSIVSSSSSYHAERQCELSWRWGGTRSTEDVSRKEKCIFATRWKNKRDGPAAWKWLVFQAVMIQRHLGLFWVFGEKSSSTLNQPHQRLNTPKRSRRERLWQTTRQQRSLHRLHSSKSSVPMLTMNFSTLPLSLFVWTINWAYLIK